MERDVPQLIKMGTVHVDGIRSHDDTTPHKVSDTTSEIKS